MTEQQPPKRFTFNRKSQQERTQKPQPIRDPKIRDKDNAQPRIKPPQGVTKPSPRMGPPGTKGIQRNLPTPANDRAAPKKETQKRFSIREPGELKKQFKPIVTKPPGKGHDKGGGIDP